MQPQRDSIMTTARAVERVLPAMRTVEGGNLVVRRSFPTAALADADPFLLLDEFGPVDFAPGEATGVPDHPHRGFETVTYLLAGEMEHRDSFGHHGRLGPGDVQWMTAGSGLVHQEMPSDTFRRSGGRLHGVQLWVNLPRDAKMTTPAYQEVPGARIPVTEVDGARVRVIAGESGGTRASIETRLPITYLHVTLVPGAQWTQPLPSGQRALAYVLNGVVAFHPDGQPVAEGRLVRFGDAGDHVHAANAGPEPCDFLLLAGVPLQEPVARYGPFVMNSESELRQAFADYQAGRMGRVD